MYKNKKASAFAFIYGMAFLGFLIILFIIFSQVARNELGEITNSSFLNLSQADLDDANEWFSFWEYVPYIIFIIVILFFIISIWQA